MLSLRDHSLLIWLDMVQETSVSTDVERKPKGRRIGIGMKGF